MDSNKRNRSPISVSSDNEFEESTLNSSKKSKSEENSSGLIADVKQNPTCFFDDDEDDILNLIEKHVGESLLVDHEYLCNWKRCLVKNIQRDSKSGDLILQLINETDNITCNCRLQGPWSHVKIEEGDIASVKAEWDTNYNCFVIKSSNGGLVTNPDYLISGTSVVGSLFCMRKSVLQEKFRGIEGDSKIMAIGSIVHEALQTVLVRRLKSYKEIEMSCMDILKRQEIIFLMYENKLTLKEAETEVRKFIPKIVCFIRHYMYGDRNYEVPENSFDGTIENIQDIEENVWVPHLGLKGKIDISVCIKRRNSTKVISMPLEIKTGKASFSSEHRGQLILYEMMLNGLGKSIESGLLLYLREGLMKEISGTWHERRDLILLRNELSYYLTRSKKSIFVNEKNEGAKRKIVDIETLLLPEPINHHSACSKCPYNTICCAFLKQDKSFDLPQKHYLHNVSNESLSHLNSEDFEYFIMWCNLLLLEEEASRKDKHIKDLWTQTPENRENLGRSIINLKLVSKPEQYGNRFTHTFKVIESKRTLSGIGSDLTLSGINEGEYIILSSNNRLAIAAGFVQQLDVDLIKVNLERDLSKNYSFETFIIDKHDSQSRNIFNFTNLGFLLDNSENSNRLREIIVYKKKATFNEDVYSFGGVYFNEIMKELNSIQQDALRKAINANEYMLIKGLPGTGKTQTLVAIIRILNLIGKSVLITSHTHSAVDNVLLKLKEHKLKFLRIGSESRISPDLINFSECKLSASCKTVIELEKMYSLYNIVGVTCLGVGHALFTHKKFDVCIVDEASQVFQPTIIRSLCFANKFILVGDPDQLPPVVKSKAARKLGADESLFHRLDSPENTSILTLQYRMNKCLTKLANDFVYKGDLKCGNEIVEFAGLRMVNYEYILEEYATQKWILKALNRHIDQSVILLDTKNCLDKTLEFSVIKTNELSQKIKKHAASNEEGNIYTNYCEAAICFSLVKALIIGDYSPKNIGIIAPYRAQVELLKKIYDAFIHHYKTNDVERMNFIGLEINTVDQYQGRDKELIIYSCTKTGIYENMKDKKKENEILEDRRRLTVAITRSQNKLILVGDEKCLENYTPFKDLFKSIPATNKIVLEDYSLGFTWKEAFKDLEFVLKL